MTMTATVANTNESNTKLSYNKETVSNAKLVNSNKWKDTWLHMIAGGVAGSVGTVLFSPLEVIKTRFQSSIYQHNLHNPTKAGILQSAKYHVVDTLSAIRVLHKTEGLRALFKGIGPTLSGVVPARSIYFFVYGNGKQYLTDLNGGKENSWIHLGSAAAAGTATATATNPIWMVRTRMQLQSEQARIYKNSFHCAYVILRTEGIRSLYKGMSASYLGVVESAVQWVIYEQLKIYSKQLRNRNATDLSQVNAHWADTLASAGSAKLFAAILAYPHEVIRTRLRQDTLNADGTLKYRGLLQAFKLVFKQEGVAGLYGGLTPHLMRVVPNAAVMFGCYEFIMHYFGSK